MLLVIGSMNFEGIESEATGKLSHSNCKDNLITVMGGARMSLLSFVYADSIITTIETRPRLLLESEIARQKDEFWKNTRGSEIRQIFKSPQFLDFNELK
jgi:hypothetical protein